MAINETVQTLLLMRADVSDLRAKMRQVQGDEKAVVKAQIDAAEARNASIKKWTDGLAKVGTAIGIATKAIEFGADAFKAFDEHSRLSAGSSKYNLDALRKSSAGLKTDLDLMRLAQKAAGAQHSISQLQLENATKAMRAFQAAGFEGAKVQEKVGEALLKGSIEPLKDLGVNLEAAKGKTAQMAQLMEVLAGKSKDAGAGVNSQTDAFTKAGVEYKNAINKMEVAIGELVVALAPLISRLAEIISMAAELGDFLSGPSGGPSYEQMRDATDRNRTAMGHMRDISKATNPLFEQNADANRRLTFLRTKDLVEKAIAGGPAKSKSEGLVDVGTADAKGPWGKAVDTITIDGVTFRPTGQTSGAGRQSQLGAGGGFDSFGIPIGLSGFQQNRDNPELLAQLDGAAAQAAQGLKDISKIGAEGLAASNESKLSKMFGPIEEFDAYATAFDMLSTTASAGFDAWVSGSESVSSAMKKMFKSNIAGLASQMFVESLKHAAYAIGSIAMHDPVGAATHAKAAAGFAAGAVAAGALARAMGGGGGGGSGGGASGGGGGGRAPSVTSGSGGGGSGVTNYNITVGDVWAPDNQRKKDREVARAIRSAERELQGSTGVTRR